MDPSFEHESDEFVVKYVLIVPKVCGAFDGELFRCRHGRILQSFRNDFNNDDIPSAFKWFPVNTPPDCWRQLTCTFNEL